jgi:Flp pilus assembly protein TadD
MAAAAMGDSAQVVIQTARMRAIDSAAAVTDIAAMPASAAPAPAHAQEALMTRGLDALKRGDAAAAATRFRELIAINATHYGAHFQLAVALDRLGRPAEARPLWERVLHMAEGYGDQATIRSARDRLARKP